MLQQGFTSARDVGGGDDTVALRKCHRLRQGSWPPPDGFSRATGPNGRSR
jgi:hypothetical protein